MKNFLTYIFIIGAVICSYIPAQAQKTDSYVLHGIVRDSVSLEPVVGASVTVKGARQGTVTGSDGTFSLTLPRSSTTLAVSCLGYRKINVPVSKAYHNLLYIELPQSSVELEEVVVRPGKYSKKNNPAVDLQKRIRKARDVGNPERNDYYNYDKYERVTIGLNNFNATEGSAMLRHFPFLTEYVDTSEVSGKPVLNISVKEQSSQVRYRRSPRDRRELVNGIRRNGIDEITDQESMQVFINDVMREIDLYDNDIVLLQNRFVSPLSPIAPDFYKFWLTDTVEVEGERCLVLGFSPHNKASFGFVGQLYVAEGDSSMFIKRVTMRVPHDINLNFINELYIAQDFEKAPDGSRLKMRDDLTLEASIVGKSSGIYARRNTAYTNHNFLSPDSLDASATGDSRPTLSDDKHYTARLGGVWVVDSAYVRSNEFWDAARTIKISNAERNMDTLMKRLRSNKVFYWGEKVVKALATGYIPVKHTDSPWDFGPLNTTISGNTAEGVRLRVGGMSTAHLSPHFFTRAYVAYGTRDRKWKYSAELEYSFNKKSYHSCEFPMHSLKLSHLYDLDQLGQDYLFTNADNVFLVLKRMSDTRVTYHRVSALDYTLELPNNFSIQATAKHERQEATKYVEFTTVDGQSLPHYDETSFTLQLRFAPGEKFYQTRSYRFPVNFDAPVVVLSHTVAPRGFLGSRYTLNRTDLSIQKRFWFSAFGYADVIAKGAHVWSRTPFPSLLTPNVNLSYTIQPESFALLYPLEFMFDTQAQWDVTYWANGALFNMVPYFKKLKLREVVAFRGVWGHLSTKNNPAYATDAAADRRMFIFPADAKTRPLDHGPYMEMSVGVENILKCLRFDWVWRLNYRDGVSAACRQGPRISLHLTF